MDPMPKSKFTLRIVQSLGIASIATVGMIHLEMSALRVKADDQVAGPFSNYDIDSNGFLSPEEFRDTKLFNRVDQNADGRISLPEARSAAKEGAFEGVKLPRAISKTDATAVPQGSTNRLETSSSTQSNETGLFSDEIRQAPRTLHPNAVGIGRHIALPLATDIFGKEILPTDGNDSRAVVIAMTGTGCPLCLKYATTLAELEEQYASRGVRFIFVNPNESENRNRIEAAIETHGFKGSYLHDQDMTVTQALGVKTSTEVFVLDRSGTLCYRGAVNDQYGFGYALDQPREHYLRDALDAVLEDRTPAIRATTSPGCEIYSPDDPATSDTAPSPEIAVTYHRDISRILQSHCITCHRENGSAPMEFERYDQVTDFGKMIASVVSRGVMPPWFADNPPPTNQIHSGLDSETQDTPAVHWANDRSMPKKDRQDLMEWVVNGMPEGDPSDAPIPQQYPSNWEIGTPDLVLEIPTPIQIKATGQMPYEHRFVSTTLTEDKWISAVEIRPTDPAVVHHVLVFVGKPEFRNRGIDEEAGFLAAFVPGNSHQIYPDGFAKKLPAGSRLIFQLHYTPNGKATADQTQLAMKFSKEPPRHAVMNRGIAKHGIAIPPGASEHLETTSLTVPTDIELLAMMPHMHVRGKAFRFELVSPTGNRSMLLNVPRYDFNWQLEYRLAEPLSIAAGSRIEISAWYDNSSDNPANPDPMRLVKWGPQTTDEMMLGYVEYIVKEETNVPSESDPDTESTTTKDPASTLTERPLAGRLFDRFDANSDGIVTQQELPRPIIFQRLDTNSDGQITKEELRQLR